MYDTATYVQTTKDMGLFLEPPRPPVSKKWWEVTGEEKGEQAVALAQRPGGVNPLTRSWEDIKEKWFQRATSEQERKERDSPVKQFWLPVLLPPVILRLYLAEEWFCSGNKEAEQLLVDTEKVGLNHNSTK